MGRFSPLHEPFSLHIIGSIVLTDLKIRSIGGLKAIIISHPHYYAAMNEWMTAFNCPVYAAPEDQEWLKNTPEEEKVTFLHEEVTEILPGVTALKAGGHFPGSFLLHWDKHLFHGDTFITNWVSFRSPDSNM